MTAKNSMQISQRGINRLKEIEGLSNYPYKDADGYSIGYGHFILPHEAFLYISDSEAELLLADDLVSRVLCVNRYVDVQLNQNQFDALVIFVYNIGRRAFKNSTLLKRLNTGGYDAVPYEMSRWNKYTVNGVKKVHKGLVARREKTASLFMDTVENA